MQFLTFSELSACKFLIHFSLPLLEEELPCLPYLPRLKPSIGFIASCGEAGEEVHDFKKMVSAHFLCEASGEQGNGCKYALVSFVDGSGVGQYV